MRRTAVALALAAACAACESTKADRCPDPADPNVRYIEGTREDPRRCEVIRFACEDGEAAFSDDCGCGCMRRN